MVSLKAVVTALAAWATLAEAAPVDSYEGSSALPPQASYVTTSGLFSISMTERSTLLVPILTGSDFS
jgi:hypothetical protein